MMDLENGRITKLLTNTVHPISAISIPPLLEFKKLIINSDTVLTIPSMEIERICV